MDSSEQLACWLQPVEGAISLNKGNSPGYMFCLSPFLFFISSSTWLKTQSPSWKVLWKDHLSFHLRINLMWGPIHMIPGLLYSISSSKMIFFNAKYYLYIFFFIIIWPKVAKVSGCYIWKEKLWHQCMNVKSRDGKASWLILSLWCEDI